MPIGSGFLSSMTFQLQGMVTLSPALGKVLLGHIEALLQYRMNFSFKLESQAVTATTGGGHKYLQKMALTSVYS